MQTKTELFDAADFDEYAYDKSAETVQIDISNYPELIFIYYNELIRAIEEKPDWRTNPDIDFQTVTILANPIWPLLKIFPQQMFFRTWPRANCTRVSTYLSCLPGE